MEVTTNKAVPSGLRWVCGVLLLLACWAGSAVADTVNLSTYQGSGWQVARAPVLNGTFAAPVPVVYAWNPAWAQPSTYGYTTLTPSATWVSNGTNGAGDVNGTTYLFSKEFVLASTFSGPGTFSLDANLGADNWVVLDGVQLSYTNAGGSGSIPVSTDGYHAGVEQGFTSAWKIHAFVDNTLFTSPTTFTLSVKVVNSYANVNNGQPPGPAGLIFAGEAGAEPQSGAPLPTVPLPAALPAGLAVLGMLGGAKALGRFSATR